MKQWSPETTLIPASPRGWLLYSKMGCFLHSPSVVLGKHAERKWAAGEGPLSWLQKKKDQRGNLSTPLQTATAMSRRLCRLALVWGACIQHRPLSFQTALQAEPCSWVMAKRPAEACNCGRKVTGRDPSTKYRERPAQETEADRVTKPTLPSQLFMG